LTSCIDTHLFPSQLGDCNLGNEGGVTLSGDF
jgi:hypothetical protein